MNILIFGRNGQVGWELQRSLAPLGTVIALDRSSSPNGDLSQPEALAATIRSLAPDVIVNAAAYTAVDRAEIQQELARTVNALAPAAMAQTALSLGALLVHYSTDYVFDGSGTIPWQENSPTAPLNVYGKTKLEGENYIRASGCRHLILRTSWVYACRGNNFLKTILHLAQERDSLNVVEDQFGTPTGAELIADVTAHAIRAAIHNDVSGTYHLAATGETNWHQYARHILDCARAAGLPLKVHSGAVLPVPSTSYPTPAPRPRNSRLDTSSLQTTFGLTLPDWKTGVTRTLSEFLDKQTK